MQLYSSSRHLTRITLSFALICLVVLLDCTSSFAKPLSSHSYHLEATSAAAVPEEPTSITRPFKHRQLDAASQAQLSPVLLPNQQLLDVENGTIVIEDVLPAADGTLSQSWQYTFNPTLEWFVVYVNNSRGTMQLSATLGSTTLFSQDVDFSYLLTSLTNAPQVQTLTIRPGIARTKCTSTTCQVTFTLRYLGSQEPRSSSLPYHMGIARGSMLLTMGQAFQSETGLLRMKCFGMEIDDSELGVLIELASHQIDSKSFITDHMLYLYNSNNPVQWLFPEPMDILGHSIGTQYNWLFEQNYAQDGQLAQRPSTFALPYQGGYAWADPNYGAIAFSPALYLLCGFATAVSQPYPGTNNSHRFDMYVTTNYIIGDSPSWNGSTYGIVGALTLLVLCILSAAVVVLRRRCSGNSHDDGLFGGPIVITRAQREGLPQFDANGRPIRYDAQGRVLPDLGAKKEDLDALPTKTFAKGMIPAEDANCTICLGDFEEGEQVTELPCGHNFHNPCITKWLLQRKHCPLCQQDIKSATNVKIHVSADAAQAAEMAPLASSSGAAPTSPEDRPATPGRTAWTEEKDNNHSTSSPPIPNPDFHATSTSPDSRPATAQSQVGTSNVVLTENESKDNIELASPAPSVLPADRNRRNSSNGGGSSLTVPVRTTNGGTTTINVRSSPPKNSIW